jgi:deoxyribodipyrimidine photolyase
MKNKSKVTIVIVNNALRLLDNPLLEDLDGQVIFVFALTPYYFSVAHYTKIPSVGENRFKYLFACLAKFKQLLKEKFNADLLVLEGSYKQVVDEIVKTAGHFNQIEVRVLHQPYQYEIMYEQELLDDPYYNLLANRVDIINEGMTLVPFNILCNLYPQYKGRSFKDFHFACLREQHHIKFVDISNINVIPVSVDIKSIEGDADCNNFYYDMKGIENYKDNKSAITGASTTKIEAALSLGTMSKTMAYGLALNYKTSDSDKGEFIRSLLWGDYCYIIAEFEGNKIFYKDGLSKNINKTKIEALPDFIKGTGTEVKFYNKAMGKLRSEGYLPNRVRIILGYYIIKVLKYSPLAFAEYFEHYLISGHPANNWIGCHSCNGTGVDTIPGGRTFNIRKQLDDWDLNKEYL